MASRTLSVAMVIANSGIGIADCADVMFPTFVPMCFTTDTNVLTLTLPAEATTTASPAIAASSPTTILAGSASFRIG